LQNKTRNQKATVIYFKTKKIVVQLKY
jgi:hypothetical protein